MPRCWLAGRRWAGRLASATKVRLVEPDKELLRLFRSNSWREALQRWTDAQHRGRSTSVLEWGAALGVCAKRHLWTHALVLLREMTQEEVEANIVCWNAAMAACTRAHSWTMALQLFSDVMADPRLTPNVVTFTTVMNNQGWQACLHLLELLKQGDQMVNLITYTAAIRACGEPNAWPHVLLLLEEMKGRSLQGDHIVVNASITACHRASAWEQAVELFESAERRHAGAATDVVSFNAAMTAWVRGSHWQQVIHLLRRLRSSGRNANAVTFNCCISAGEKAAQWQMSLKMLQEICREGAATVVSFNAAITACERASAWDVALHLLQEMSRNTVQPDSGSCAALLTALGAGGGPWEMALWLLELGREAMQLHGATPSPLSLKELMERALTPIVRAQRLTEALMVYREGKAAGVWPGHKGRRLLDLHDFSLESAQVAVCHQLLVSTDLPGDLVIVTGRGSHSREGGVSIETLLTHLLDQLNIAVRPDPYIAGVCARYGNPASLSMPFASRGAA